MKTNPELLLHPNIPKPLHGLNPRTIMGQGWWDEKRQEAYRAREFHCWACGVHKGEAAYHHWLEAHENYYIDYLKGRMWITEIVALCHSCHNFIHNGRMVMQYDRQMPRKKFWGIMHHGFTVLKKAKLQPNPFALRACASVMDVGWVPRWALSVQFDETLENNPIPSGETAEWNEWRLVFNGIEHEPIHESFEAWLQFYKGENDR